MSKEEILIKINQYREYTKYDIHQRSEKFSIEDEFQKMLYYQYIGKLARLEGNNQILIDSLNEASSEIEEAKYFLSGYTSN